MATHDGSEISRDIPDRIMREVRQRCGFGCVICGLPLYEYEHMLGFANVKRHVAGEITLLCDRHHREKTSGLLPAEDVIAANADPYNLRSGVSKPYDLHYSGTSCEVVIGDNSFRVTDAFSGSGITALSIDGEPLIGFRMSQNHLLLHLKILDENDNLVLLVEDNQVIYAPTPWDIQMVGRTLTVHEKSREFLIKIEFQVPDKIVVSRGRFLTNGYEVCVTPRYALLVNNGSTMSGSSFVDISHCIAVGSGELSAGIRMPMRGRYPAGSRPRYPKENRLNAIKQANETRKKLDAYKLGIPPTTTPHEAILSDGEGS